MDRNAGGVAEKPTVMVNGQAKTLPDENFWQRYSPHYEFPLSSVTSAAIHIIAIALIVVGIVALLNGWWKSKEPPSIEPIVLVVGGDPKGDGPSAGTPAQPSTEAVDPQADLGNPSRLPKLPELPRDKAAPVPLSNDKTEDGPLDIDRTEAETKALNEALRKLLDR
jgi:hypothetical protein